MKTYSAKPSEVVRKWYVIDAADLPLGRISTAVADLLTGKKKPMYTPHIDCGDYVIIINAKNLVVTGKKLEDKMYYKHSNYPGGLTETTMQYEMDKDPTKVIFQSVRGMLQINKLRDERLKRLKIYADAEHNHEAQKPEVLNLKKGK
jgi:large subunit ribosomal protein L13